MHILPQLRKLEEAYPEEIVVLGVHSAKFPAEKETDALRQAILRYDIRHPVVNDRDFQVWQRYAARAWPSLYIVDPEGKVLGKHEGEYRFEDLDHFLHPLIEAYDIKGLIQRSPTTWTLERDKQAAENALAFPGKLLADEPGNRLFVADSGHHRIVVATLDGEVRDVIGDGKRGLRDGGFSSAQFNDPQGIALDGDSLYVADKENHALRKVDLAARTVETIAGTGESAMTFHAARPGEGHAPSLAVGRDRAGRHALHRHGRHAPALVDGPRLRHHRPLRRQRPRGPQRRPPQAGMARSAHRHRP